MRCPLACMSDAGEETSAARAEEGCHCRALELPPSLSTNVLLGLLLPLRGSPLVLHGEALFSTQADADMARSTGAVADATRPDADAGHMDEPEAAKEEA